MYVGILTAPFGKEPLEHVAAFAGEYGFGGMEVSAGPGSNHIDLRNFTQADADRVKDLMERRALVISSLAAYTNNTDADPARRAASNDIVRKAIDAASLLGVDVVCTLAGHPVPGKTKMQTIEEECPKVFQPLVEYAERKQVKIALENWYATNIQHLGHWERLFQLVPSKSFGLNYDPSHLLWQDIDYVHAVERFADRIFHTHAKDTAINEAKRRWVGNQDGGGWWRYVVPGMGQVKWGEYLAALRQNGYSGVLSIEHEDSAVGREEGFLMGKKYLEQFFIPSVSTI
ncbi:MAG TPA: sugar phosphate isomerase/epimerase [Chthonomonadales bacterium]|nr:sugar phosphate isomerase/epimerase [Chthonomonadales bacterium]